MTSLVQVPAVRIWRVTPPCTPERESRGVVCVIAAPAGDLPKCGAVVTRRAGRKRALTAVVGTVAAAAVLVWVLTDRRGAFLAALGAAPIAILVVAAVLQLVALVARTESWHVCVSAAGGQAGAAGDCTGRRASASVGSQLNSHLGTAARIAALRRSGTGKSARACRP